MTTSSDNGSVMIGEADVQPEDHLIPVKDLTKIFPDI